MWATNSPDSQSKSRRDIHISLLEIGRNTFLSVEEENSIAVAVLYYASNLTSLSLTAAIELAETVLKSRSVDIDQISLIICSLGGFIIRHQGLKVVTFQIIEANRIDAVTPDYICEHISRLKVAIKRYIISSSKFMFNIN